jgi:predicted RNA-binding Zn ribbon-like protein
MANLGHYQHRRLKKEGVLGRYSLPNQAPAPLSLVQEFVNTVDLERARDWLADPMELGRWLRERGLGKIGRLTEAELKRAVELREALRVLLRANNRGSVSEDALASVNHAAQAAGIVVQLNKRGKVELVQRSFGLDAALGQILAIAFSSMLSGEWMRLKACRNCGWIFHDRSRSRTASWCSMAICGNRLKTRAYRQRRSPGSGLGRGPM